MRASRDLIEHLKSLPRGILRHERSVPGIVGAVKPSLDAPIAGGIVESAKRGETLFATEPMNRSAPIRAIVRAGSVRRKIVLITGGIGRIGQPQSRQRGHQVVFRGRIVRYRPDRKA